LRRLGQRRLAELMIRTSKGAWRDDKAAALLAAAADTLELWAGGGIDFAELAADIAAEVRIVRSLNDQIDQLEARMVPLFAAADRRPDIDDGDERGVIAPVPGLAGVLGAGILARFGDLDRFANLAGVRSFTGLVPKIDQSGLTHGHRGVTKAGDPGLREVLYLAADYLRHIDPQLAARYHRLIVETGKHHDSALCHLATTLATRLAACWRRRERYMLRDIDGTAITPAQGRAIVAERYKIPDHIRQTRRRASHAKQLKQRTARRNQESTKAAPAPGQSGLDASEHVA
jgi:transposase